VAIRGGVRENAEVCEPLSNPIQGKAIKCMIYSLGAGFNLANVRLNIAYGYSDMKHVDTGSNAASINQEICHNVLATVSYDLPL
jgi:hypothetical protein